MLASCTHVSAVLHALVAATFVDFTIKLTSSVSVPEDLPGISYPCQWKAPRKSKENTLRLADAVFEKHVYGKGKKRRLAPLEDVDPRPAKFKGTARHSLPGFWKMFVGKGCAFIFCSTRKYVLTMMLSHLPH